eukprot:108123-Hanusia_phi.AAC.4
MMSGLEAADAAVLRECRRDRQAEVKESQEDEGEGWRTVEGRGGEGEGAGGERTFNIYAI